MSTRQNRKGLNVLNDTLRANNSTMRSRQAEMLSHIQTLIRRQKQLSKLKQQLLQQVQKSRDQLIKEKTYKEDKCTRLEIQITELAKQMGKIDLTMINLQEQYKLCLNDYDKVLKEVAQQIQSNKVIELQLQQEIEKRSTIQAMIFDYERLQRVLEEERKYFRELSVTEEKSHQERMKQFESIKERLIKQEKQALASRFMDRVKIGFTKLNKIFTSKFRSHSQLFIRGSRKYDNLTSLGISKFKNCLTLATSRYNKQIKSFFTAWHNNVFSKDTIFNIVQNSLKLNFQSRTKIQALNRIVQKLNSDNLNLLHLYERTKVVCQTANVMKKKQIHLAFWIWRERSAFLTKVKFWGNAIEKGLSKAVLRNAFNELKEKVHTAKRFQVASHLLTQYENTKGMAWAMRRWRCQTKNHEIQVIQKYIQTMKKHHLIQQRVKYQKRKVKSLTGLQLCMQKIQLRNYFNRYYENVKKDKIAEIQGETEGLRDLCVEARKENKIVRQFCQDKHEGLALSKLFEWGYRFVASQGFQALRRHDELEVARKEALMLVILKKQGKTKYYVMNEFRKNVQFYQKKEMHQVLTDLNHKMQEINQKSTQYRQALKATIQNLGQQSSKKVNQVLQYTLDHQHRTFFNWYSRKSIQKKYKSTLVERMVLIFQAYGEKFILNALKNHSKETKQDKILEEKQKKYAVLKRNRLLRNSFGAILGQLKIHKSAFSKMIHAENVMYFYRLECAMIAIKRKVHQVNMGLETKVAQDLQDNLTKKQAVEKDLKGKLTELQTKLKAIFIKLVSIQSKPLNKKVETLECKSYFRKIYKKSESIRKLTKMQQNLEKLQIFTYSKLLVTSFQRIYAVASEVSLKQIQSEVVHLNKKLEDQEKQNRSKLLQIRYQIEEMRKNDKTQTAQQLREFVANTIEQYRKRHQISERQNTMKEIFKEWKGKAVGARRMFAKMASIRQDHMRQFIVLFRRLHSNPKQLYVRAIHDVYDNLRHHRISTLTHSLYLCNQSSLKTQIEQMHHNKERVEQNIESNIQIFFNQMHKNREYRDKKFFVLNLRNKCMQRRRHERIVKTVNDSINHRIKGEVLHEWNWWKLCERVSKKRLESKENQWSTMIKTTFFGYLKSYRQALHNFAYLSQNLITTLNYHQKRFAMSKITNVASHQKQEHTYQQRRALRTLASNTFIYQRQTKRTTLWKWQGQLIPRQHYVFKVLIGIQKRIMKSAFACINQSKYWNEYYIKDIADKVTVEGYAEVNSVTNILVRQGFDPDELKNYLKKRNEKDTNIIKQAVGHLQTWPEKPMLIQAFHSWKQYVNVRKNIKKSLTKVFNFSSGLGRYFSKWRKKDPSFNEMLQRQSRYNMLQRYKDLDRLMKEYRRDINNSLTHCEQLKQINDEYTKSTSMTVQMALSNIANSVHKGMKQGLSLWRQKAKSFRKVENNQRYDEIVDGIQLLDQRRRRVRQRIYEIQAQNNQLKEKCKWGHECGQLLKKLMQEKDGLSIDLAQKQHNLKILLQDNLRLKQKIKTAQDSALKLINKIKAEQNVPV